MIERFGARAIALAVIGVILMLVAIGGLTQCQKLRRLAAQNKVNQGQLEAQGNSAADAIATTGNVSADERASEELTRDNDKEIRNAPGANDPVNPAARDAGLKALCRRIAYRDSPRCKEALR